MSRMRDYFMHKYPRTDFHELNQDWLISMLFDMIDQVENFVQINAVKYADPITWDITKQYEKNTIVIVEETGVAYISTKAVPRGVNILRTDYWTSVFDLSRFLEGGLSNFAVNYENQFTYTATMPTEIGHWLVWDSKLYVALTDITIGDMYAPNVNIRRTTVEQEIASLTQSLTTAINNEATARQNADATLQNNINSEVTARQSADNNLHTEIVNESVARENADSTLQDNIDTEATARQNADTTLQGNITAEATARQNADSALSARIDQETIDRQTADTNLLNQIHSLFGDNVLIVAKHGANFSTINGAVDAIRSLVSASNPYIILITSGTYQEHIDLTGVNGLTLYGLGNVIISDTSTYPMGVLYVTGEIAIHNLRLVQYGDSYCIHSDTQGTNSPVRLTAHNCVFQRTQMSQGTYQHCIGWGSCDVGGDTYDIFNCNFIGGTGLGGHLNPFTTATGNVAWRVSNCSFSVERAMIDWGDACNVINGTKTPQKISAVFSGNTSNKGIIEQISVGESYNYFKNGEFCTLYLSGGNNIPALNNVGPSTQWFYGSFAQTNSSGKLFVPFKNAHQYELSITYAVLDGNNTDISGACSIFSKSPLK